MLTLRELQESFWSAVAHTPGRATAASTLMEYLPASATQNAQERLQVYVDAYFLRLQQVMAETFPKAKLAVGEERFGDLVRAYLAAYPSQRPSIAYVGARFSEFLRGCEDMPDCLADLARLEWTRAEVFEAKDAAPLGVDALRSLPATAWETVRFVPIPALQIIHSTWPVTEIWRDAGATGVVPTPTTVRVWRCADWRVLHSAIQRHRSA
jgi:hypothetical protein